MKTVINIKKKNSFAKILGMKLADNKENIIVVSLILFSIVFICYPLIFKQIPNRYVFINLTIVLVTLFIITPLFNFIIANINSLRGMQYIPLTENEINFIGCFSINKYVDFINEIITYDNCLFNNYRARVPSKLISQVIEFGNTYYSTNWEIDYDYDIKKFIITQIITKKEKENSNENT